MRAMNTTHGMTGTRPFVIWTGMHRRCYYPDDAGYKNYGGRGIRVCERWHSFENFWVDMQPAYASHLTLHRIDGDLDYAPGNCIWATYKTQNRRRRNNRIIATPAGEMVLSEAAEMYGIHPATLWYRLASKTFPVDELFVAAKDRK
jgi:hypothetical protein